MEQGNLYSYEDLESRYQNLDQLINKYDTEGNGPLKKGEEPFRWSFVEVEAKFLIEKIPDIRLAIFLIRALTIQKGLHGLTEGLKVLLRVLEIPRREIRPFPDDEENSMAVHAICLGWLGSEEFLALVHMANICPGINLGVGDILVSSSAIDALLPEQRETALVDLESVRDELLQVRSWISDGGDFWDRDPITVIDFLSDFKKMISFGNKKDYTERAEIIDVGISNTPLLDIGKSDQGFFQIENRSDLKKTIDLMLRYYEENEPSHPGPIFLQRVRRMVDASFEQVLEEFYADAPSLIEKIKNPFPKI
jgi:type VI secretion system protein ImpA